MRIFAWLSWSALALFSVSPLLAANAPGDAAEKAEAVAKKKLSVAHIEITGGYSEGVTAPGLFGDVVETLGTGLQRLDKAARDESLDAVILHISDPSIGWAKLNELRVGIQKMRAKGRKVYAWMESADTKGYLIAAACDQIVLPESGMYFCARSCIGTCSRSTASITGCLHSMQPMPALVQPARTQARVASSVYT